MSDGWGEGRRGGCREKRGKTIRGGIDGYVMKEKEGENYDDANSGEEQKFDDVGKEGTEWGSNERDEGDGGDNNEESDLRRES